MTDGTRVVADGGRVEIVAEGQEDNNMDEIVEWARTEDGQRLPKKLERRGNINVLFLGLAEAWWLLWERGSRILQGQELVSQDQLPSLGVPSPGTHHSRPGGACPWGRGSRMKGFRSRRRGQWKQGEGEAAGQ